MTSTRDTYVIFLGLTLVLVFFPQQVCGLSNNKLLIKIGYFVGYVNASLVAQSKDIRIS